MPQPQLPLPHPALPPEIPPEQIVDHMGLLTTLLNDLLTSTDVPLLPTGLALWRGLSLIVVSWTGLRIAFSGGNWGAWDIVRVLLTLSIPFVMLTNYDAPVPGVGMPFPMIIPGGANFISGIFVGAVPAQMFEAFNSLFQATTDLVQEQLHNFGPLNLLRAGVSGLYSLSITVVVLPLFCLLLLLIFCFAYAQVVFAKVVIALLIFLGPVFIPFFVFQPLAFLFWGWFRSLFVYSLYSAVAGTLLYVWSAVGLTYVNTFNRTLTNPDFDPSALGWSAAWFVSLVPLAVAAVLCSTKVGEIASSLVSGGGGGGMNVAGMVTTGAMVAAGGAGKIAAVVGKK